MPSTMAGDGHNTYYHMLKSTASLVSLKVDTLPSFDLALNDSARRGFPPSLDTTIKMIPLGLHINIVEI